MEDQQGELEVMLEKVGELYSTTQYQTTLRLAEEAHRKAKQGKQLIPLLNANFYIMNSANSSMEYHRAVEACLETIPLLESESEAAKLQPDYDPTAYYQHQWWLSACTYDNLATATASLKGHNADGLHQCIADGIAVCQRTGKTRCITCFREYATEVFIAADDLQMARKHAETNAKRGDESGERLWVSTRDLLGMAILEGDFESADKYLQQAPKHVELYYNKEKAQSDLFTKTEELKIMTGEIGSHADLESRREAAKELRNADENPRGFFELDKNDALLHVVLGNTKSAKDILAKWDRDLLAKKLTKDWFDVRLRLLALFALDEDWTRFDKLAKPLLKTAKAANDWLSVRRFHNLKNAEVTLTPLALLGNPSRGVYAMQETPSTKPGSISSEELESTQANTQEETGADAGSKAVEELALTGPQKAFADAVSKIQGRFLELMQQGGDAPPEIGEQLWADVVQLPTSDGPSLEVARLLFLAEGISWRAKTPWRDFEWLKSQIERFPDDARIISLAASVADELIQSHAQAVASNKENSLPYDSDGSPRSIADADAAPPESSEASKENMPPGLPAGLTLDWIREQHETAIDLAGDQPKVFSRAGGFFYAQQDLDRAERYLSRASRLDRSDSFAAYRLAEIYRNSDRQIDALSVLDLCVRSGTEDSDIIWEAILAAKAAERYEELLTYVERFDSLNENYPWSAYYAADALLALQRWEDALARVERLKELDSDSQLAVLSMESQARANIAPDSESTQEVIRKCLGVPFRASLQISPQGISAGVERLYAAAALLQDPELKNAVVSRFAPTGFLPDQYYESLVDREQEPQCVHYFVVTMRHVLGEDWPYSENALVQQADWTEALQSYGVVATDEEQAVKAASAFHASHWDSEWSVDNVNQASEEEYQDVPHIVWCTNLYPPGSAE